MKYFNQAFIDFFKELAANNHKEWFDENRKTYEQEVKLAFQYFIDALIKKISEKDKRFEDLSYKDCVFRINRDVRFSKDKTPYKLMSSAIIAPGGKKSRAIDGIYLELSPAHVRVYGGIYELDKDGIYDIREGIHSHLMEFQKITTNPKFKQVFCDIKGEKNKIIPKEFQASAAIEPLLFNKQWYFYTEFSPSLILSENLMDEVLAAYEIGKPLMQLFTQFLNYED